MVKLSKNLNLVFKLMISTQHFDVPRIFSQHIHIESLGHCVELAQVKILDRQPRYFERGVKEAIYIRVNKPSQRGLGPIEVNKSVLPDFGITCPKNQ